MLHSRLLVLAGSSATVLAAGTVKLPGEVKGEGTACRVGGRELANTEDGCTRLVGVEGVITAQIERQRASTVKVEVLLYSDT